MALTELKSLNHTVGLNRISASHDTNNIASGRVMQKCGMTFEGIQRQAHYCVRRGFYDSACYAILKYDFEKINNIQNYVFRSENKSPFCGKSTGSV